MTHKDYLTTYGQCGNASPFELILPHILIFRVPIIHSDANFPIFIKVLSVTSPGNQWSSLNKDLFVTVPRKPEAG